MATSGFGSEAENVERLIKWPLEYVAETEEYLCGWCGQVLIPSHTTDHLEAHFKRCKSTKNNGLLRVFKELRFVSQNFKVLSADISDIKKDLDSMKTEVKELKADVVKIKTDLIEKAKKQGMNDAALAAVFSKVNILEEKMRKMSVTHEVQMTEVSGRVSGVNETISTVVHSILEGVKVSHVSQWKRETETLSERVKANNRELGVMKTQLEDERAKSELAQKKSFHVEPSPFDQLTIPMNCFNLVTHNYLFRPSYRWTIDGIEALMGRKVLELNSELFQWSGYPVQARAKLRVKESHVVYLSLSLEHVADGELAKDLTPIPQVFYLLRDKEARNARHKCLSHAYLFNAAFSDSLLFDISFVHKSWLKNSAYNVDDSVEMEIYVEPYPMTQLVHSYDGTLEWNIENYKRRLELVNDSLVYNQASPYFYTGPRGYRVQVEICLKWDDEEEGEGGGGPKARVLFLAGKFDAQLPKSFPHSTTVTLMNRKDPERSVSKTVVEDIASRREYVLEICKFEEVKELVENDALFCKVVVKSVDQKTYDEIKKKIPLQCRLIA